MTVYKVWHPSACPLLPQHALHTVRGKLKDGSKGSWVECWLCREGAPEGSLPLDEYEPFQGWIPFRPYSYEPKS